MPEFMMIMKGPGGEGDWLTYINKLKDSGMFRGGSILGNGLNISKHSSDRKCTVTGFMRFEADNIDQVRALVEGNPDYESGGHIEILEMVFG